MPYILEIPAQKTISKHFFIHKGEEMGYIISGKIDMIINNKVYEVKKGDVVYLKSEIPSQWKNIGKQKATIL